MSKQRGKMDARISCTTEIRDALRHIADGAGVNYDELIRYLLDKSGFEITDDATKGKMAGIILMAEIAKFKAPDDEKDTKQ
jgi:hypothetical protein